MLESMYNNPNSWQDKDADIPTSNVKLGGGGEREEEEKKILFGLKGVTNFFRIYTTGSSGR